MNPKKLFISGLNCSQSVFVPFAVDKGIDKDIALKMMSPFGGGIAKTDNLCGAVTGGISAIGLHFGHTSANDLEKKQHCTQVTQKFIKEFKKEFGETQCTKLIKYNLGLEDEAKLASESGVFDTNCTQYVEKAGIMVEKLIDEHTSI